MNMKLFIQQDVEHPADENRLSRLAQTAAVKEGLELNCYAVITLCDDETIRRVNWEQRHVDAVTDVLSFPSVDYPVGETARNTTHLIEQEWDTEQSACFLGEVLLALPTVQRQANDYGHSFERELGYLLVHGILHLFGYDHQNKEDKQRMRKQEESILMSAQAPSIDEATLLKQARAAREQAYVPYSNYRVGASLLGADGNIYTGCNVENASFGLTNCGERTAVFKAVSAGCREFLALAIAADAFPPWPCGACRQVLSEFSEDMPVYITWGENKVERSTLKALLPHSFSPAAGVTDILKKGE